MSAAQSPHPLSDNFGEGEHALRNEVMQFEEDCARLAGQEIDEKNQGLFADLIIRDRSLRKAVDETRVAEKAPYLAAEREIDARYGALTDRAKTAVSAPSEKLRLWNIEQDEKRAEAARAAEQRARELAAQAEAKHAQAPASDPFTRFQAESAAREIEAEAASAAREATTMATTKARVASAAGIGRGIGLKSVWRVEVQNWDDLVLHYCQDIGVREAALKRATADMRASKRSTPIPGCAFVESKEVA